MLAAKAAVDAMTAEARVASLDARYPEPASWLGPRGALRYHIRPDGHRMAGYYWPAPQPKAVVILVHGQGSYLVFDYLKNLGAGQAKSFAGSWVAALNAAGFSCAGIDNRGAGRSGGMFGYMDRYSHLVDDLLEFTRCVGRSDIPGFAGLPVFLLGISLGGCISLHAALEQPSMYQGVLLLAPMISLAKIKTRGLNPILLRVAALLNLIVPTWPLAKTPHNDRFPELQADFDSDPVTYSAATRVRTGVQCLAACDSACARMHALNAPLLVFHSTADDMTDPDGSKALVAAAKSPDKTLRLLTDMWHVLTKEQGNEQLLAECIDWMLKHLPTPQARPRQQVAAA